MGFGNGVVWLWMPLPGELLTIDTHSGAVTRLRTGLPESDALQLQTSPYYDPVKRALLVQMVSRKRSSSGAPESSLFRWTQARPEWLGTPLCAGAECPGIKYTLAGADDAGQAVFASSRLQQFCTIDVTTE